jgi:hypothetical protein
MRATTAIPTATARAVTATSGHCCAKTAGRPGAKVLRESRRHMGCDTLGVDAAVGIVVIVVTLAAIVIAVGILASSARGYEQIGRGGLSLRDGTDRPAGEPAAGATAASERDEEIRQMLEARNALRVRHGREPVDVDAEVRALARAPVDPALEAEVRQFVLASNERRVRRGRPPLDVEAEVARRLRDLGGGER